MSGKEKNHGKDASFPANGIGAYFLPSEKGSSLGGTGLIGMACYSLWAVSPGEAASEVPAQRRFVSESSCLLRIGPGAGALAQLFVGKAKPELFFSC